MPLDESLASLMMAANLGSALGGGAPRVVEAPDGTRIVFHERSNASSDGEAGRARTVFSGAFSVNGETVLDAGGQPAEGGFEADFEEVGGPVAARVWLARPVEGAARRAFEAVFAASFDDDGLHMDIGPEAFLAFSDSSCWTAFVDEDEDDPIFEG